MAIDFGMSIGFEVNDLIVAMLITQFIAFPSTLAFGHLGGKIGTKRAIYIAIAVYLLITIWGALIRHKTEFYILAMAVGLVRGSPILFRRWAKWQGRVEGFLALRCALFGF
ncbi:hypothetical protein ACFLU6_15010 [Acidobacteriota bacterium]